MPEVGVLNLTIHDNSETAAEGLDRLTGALDRIQGAIGNGLKLSGISKPLNTFAKSVGANAKTFASVGTFLNAMKEYQKAFKDAENIKFNTAPLEAIKDAIGDGIKIGQAGTQINKIKEALGGGWDTAQSANIKTVLQDISEGAKSFQGTNIGGTAKGLEAISKALGLFAKNGAAVKEMMQGETDLSKEQMKSLEDAAKRQKEWFEAGGFKTGKLMPLNLQQFAGKGDFQQFKNTTKEITEGYRDFVEKSKAVESAGARNMEFIAKPLQALPGMYNDMAQNLEIYRSGLFAVLPKIQQMSSEEMVLAANARKAKEEISGLIKQLESFGSPKGMALQGVVDAVTGVLRTQGGEGMINASTTMFTPVEEAAEALQHFGAASEGTIRIFDRTSNAYKEVYVNCKNVAEGANEASNNIDNMKSSVSKATDAYEDYMKAAQGSANSFAIQKIFEGLEGTNDTRFADVVNDINGIGREALSAKESMDAFLEGMQDGSNYGQYIAGLNPELAEVSSNFQDASEAVRVYADAASEATNENTGLSFSFRDLGDGIKKMFPTITRLVQRFRGMMIMRGMRYIIRHISAGFSEGVQNVYQYSKAINGSFAPAMDDAATAIQQMKNSLGAALAPVIQSLIPILQTVVNWFINLVNYVNQFFALLRGQNTWTRALPATVNAFDKQTKAAKSAGAAMKDLLADWDELNIIQSQTGGNGGAGTGKTAEDYLKMFEEVGRFDNKIKDIANYIKDHIGDTLNIVKDIGLAILGWKFSNAFTGILGKLGSLATIGLVVKLSADVTSFIDDAYTASSDQTLLIADAVLNGALAAVSGKLAGAAFGKPAGEITAGLTLAVSAGATFASAQEAKDIGKEAEARTLGILGLIKDGIAGALVTAGFIAAKVALPLAVVGGIATISVATLISFSMSYTAKKMQEEKEAAEELFKNKSKGGIDPVAYLDALQVEFDKATEGHALVLNAFVDFHDYQNKVGNAMKEVTRIAGIIRGGGTLTSEEASAFKDGWKTVMSTLDDMSEASYKTILSGLNESLAAAVGEAKQHIEELRTAFIQVQHNVDEDTANLYKELDEIVNRLIKKNYKSDSDYEADLQRYSQLSEAISLMTDTTYDNLKKSIEAGKGLDFSETGLEGVKEWIANVGSASDEAKKSVDEAMDAYTESIDFRRKKVDALVAAGTYTPEQAKEINKMFDELIAIYQDTTDKKKKEIKEKTEKAYSDALSSAFSGELTPAEWRHIVLPILKSIKEAGGDIPVWMIDELKKGMEGNLYNGQNALTDDFFWALFRNSGAFGAGKTAEEAAKTINERIKNIINGGEGEDWFIDTAKLFNVDGLDLLSDEWKQEILAHARGAGLDDQFINDLMNELGITEEKRIPGIENKVKKRVEGITEEIKKEIEDADFARAVKEETIDVTNIPGLVPLDMSELIIGAITGGTAADKSLDVPIDIKLQLIDIDTSNIEDEVRRAIQESLLDDSKVDVYEMDALDTKFGLDLVNKILEQMENEGMNPDGTFGKLPSGMRIASTGINYGPNNAPVNYANLGGGNTVVTEPKDPQQEISNTASGVERGNRNLESLMRDLLAAMNRVGDRPITVSLFPSSGWGSTNRKSEAQYEAVTGDIG